MVQCQNAFENGRNYTSIHRGAMMKGGVFIGSYAYLTNDRLPEMNSDDDWQVGPILVKCGASIGAGGELIEGLRARGIGSRVYYPLPVHQQPLCRSLSYDDQLPMVEHACQQVLSLPAHPGVGPDDLAHVAHDTGGE